MSGSNETDDPMMQMYFYADCSATILFKTWKSSNCKEMFGSCMIIIILAICYEGIRFIRNEINYWIKTRTQTSRSSRTNDTNEESDEIRLLHSKHLFDKLSKRQQFGLIHILQSFLYFIQIGLGYFLMLVAMTFNAWLFLSICIGGGVGFLCFNFRKYLELADVQPTNGHRTDEESEITENDHH